MDSLDLNILGFIPARADSKGIPNKHLRRLGGKPVIAYTIQAAMESKLLNRIILSTDSEEIAEIGLKMGAEVPFLRPKDLAGDESKIGDAIFHLTAYLKEKENYTPDIFVSLFPTSPFRRSGLVDDILRTLFVGDRVNRVRGEYIVQVVVCSPNHFHPEYTFALNGERPVPFHCLLREEQTRVPGKTYVISGSVGPHFFSEERCRSVFNVHVKHIRASESKTAKDVWVNEKTGNRMPRVRFVLSDIEGVELDDPTDLFEAIAVSNNGWRSLI